MATLKNKRKFVALIKENCEEYPRSNLPQKANVPRSQEDYITQVSEEFEDRVTKKLFQEFNRTENGFLGALSQLDEFFEPAHSRPLRERPGTHLAQTRERMRTTP